MGFVVAAVVAAGLEVVGWEGVWEVVHVEGEVKSRY